MPTISLLEVRHGAWAAGMVPADLSPLQGPASPLEPENGGQTYLGQQSFTLFLSLSSTYILAFKIISFLEQKQSSF